VRQALHAAVLSDPERISAFIVRQGIVGPPLPVRPGVGALVAEKTSGATFGPREIEQGPQKARSLAK